MGSTQTYDPHGDDDRMAGFGGCTNCASREMRSNSNGDSPGMDRILCNHDAGAHACGHGESRPQKNPITGQKSDCKQGDYDNYCRDDSPYHYNDPGSW